MYEGVFKAVVRDISDPAKLGRVRCHCPSLMGGADTADGWLGWARPKLPLGSSPSIDSGSLVIPPLGSTVNISFESHNPDFPVYEGGVVTGSNSTTSSVPKLARGQDDGSLGTEETVEGVAVPKSSGGSSTYPHLRMVKTPAGHIVELDDTTGNRRIRIRHCDGSFVELRSLGDLLFYAVSGLIMYAAQTIKIASKVDIILAAGGTVKLGGATGPWKMVVRHEDDVNIGVLSAVAMDGVTPLPVTFTFTPVGSIPVPVPGSVTLSGKAVASTTKVESL